MKKYLISILLLLLSLAFISCETDNNDEAIEEPGPPPEERDLNFGDDILEDLEMGEYDPTEIESWRKEKDEYFMTSSESPLPSVIRNKFKKLNYYPIDEKYVIRTELLRFEEQDTVGLMTSTGKIRTMIRYGKFEFSIDGKEASLTAFVAPEELKDPDHLFIPFEDKTTGKETYEAGRYLDLNKVNENQYIIDFNKAYSPYCAYNDQYSCPLVPAENKLDIPIRAGEKIYEN